MKLCEEAIERFKLSKKLLDSGNNVEIYYPNSQPHCSGPSFPPGLPANVQRLEHLYMTSEFSNVDISIEGHDLIGRSHKVILGVWILPFMKVKQRKLFENPGLEKCYLKRVFNGSKGPTFGTKHPNSSSRFGHWSRRSLFLANQVTCLNFPR